MQETKEILDAIKEDHSAVVDEVLKILSIWQIQKILKNLLKENVSIGRLSIILEALVQYVYITTDIRFLTEKTRQALADQICFQYANEERVLHVLILDPSLEQKIIESKSMNSAEEEISALEPNVYRAWIKALGKAVKTVVEQGFKLVILCTLQARYLTRTALEREYPEVAVLSVNEITIDYTMESLGVIKLDDDELTYYLSTLMPGIDD